MRHEFLRFLLVGATNTALSYLLYLLLLSFMAYLSAYSIAYCAGIVMSYFLNIRFVFKKSVSLVSFLKFPLVYLIQYGVGAITLWLLVTQCSISAASAMLAVIVVTIPITFVFSKLVLK